MKKAAVTDILNFLLSNGGVLFSGNPESGSFISGGKNINEASSDEITFLSQKYKSEASKLISGSGSKLIIIDQIIADEIKPNVNGVLFIACADPKQLMVKCLTHFFVSNPETGVHPTVLFGNNVSMGKDCYIGPYTVIEQNVTIGDHCRIEAHVHIKENSVIGNNVYIKSGSVIGGKGFGFVKDANEDWEGFPHFGKVILEDHVEVGSNTCIDKGALGDTVIGYNTKIDNLVHIAHNVRIGKNCLIIADAMLGGSVVIGENTWVAPSSSLKNGLSIGANSVIGMGAVVVKNIPDGTTVVGNPASPLIKK